MIYDKHEIIRLKQEGKSWAEIGEYFGVKAEAVRTYVRKQDWYHEIKNENPNKIEGMAYSRNERGEYSIDNEFIFDEQKLFTDEDLLKMNNLDPEIFELLRVRRGRWSATIKDGQRKWNFQSRIDARPIIHDGVDYEKIIKRLTDKLNPRPQTPYMPLKSDKYLVIPLFDLHIGNNSIKHYKDSIGKIFNILDKSYKEVCIISGGDILHCDNHNGTTSSGTVIDKVDMTQAWEDAFDIFDMIMDKALKSADKVNVLYVPGNHDEMTGQTIFKALEKVYSKEKRVSIDSRQHVFKAQLLGSNFIAAAHGDKSKKAKYPMIYATTFPSLWGADGVRTREAFVGHLHHEKQGGGADMDGLYIRQAPTRAKTDKWHLDNGFTGAHKRINIVEYDEYEPSAVYYV